MTWGNRVGTVQDLVLGIELIVVKQYQVITNKHLGLDNVFLAYVCGLANNGDSMQSDNHHKHLGAFLFLIRKHLDSTVPLRRFVKGHMRKELDLFPTFRVRKCKT